MSKLDDVLTPVFFGNESLNFNQIDRAKSEPLLTNFKRQQRLIALLLVGLLRFGMAC